MSLTIIMLSLVAIYLAVKFSKWYQERRRLVTMIEKLPGPANVPFIPFLNHAMLMIYLDFLKHSMGTYALAYHVMMNFPKCFPDTGIIRIWLGPRPVVILYSPENIESILTSTTVINKSHEYRFFEPWLGQGLITSKGAKWRLRRKILTPAFHFRILSDFLPIINQEATKLIKKLNDKRYLGEKGECKTFDVNPIISLCTLDAICESAMGVNINCQADENSPYVHALHRVAELALSRTSRPWMWYDFIFNRTEAGRQFKEFTDATHAFTSKVILERKAAWQAQLSLDTHNRSSGATNGQKKETTTKEREKENPPSTKAASFVDDVMSSEFFKGKKRLAFLDLLLHQHLVEKTMTIEQVREEVDTFMFAGHDTTAVTMSWGLYMLGLHKEIQDRVREELDGIIASDDVTEQTNADEKEDDGVLAKELKVTDITVEQIREMKYFDRVIKELLRIWCSVPFVARSITEDITVGGKYLIPKGASCVVLTHALHNNPKIYPRPEIFDPDRFLPENSAKRHPYSYIPFSAGPRNCIGQKYGMMEVKVVLAKVIRNYYIETYEHQDKLAVVGEVVLRSRHGINIRLIPRFK